MRAAAFGSGEEGYEIVNELLPRAVLKREIMTGALYGCKFSLWDELFDFVSLRERHDFVCSPL